MKCEQLLRAVNDYVDGRLEPEICAEFEQHLAGCNPCQVVVDNIRKTIRLYKDGEEYQVPEALSRRLKQVLRERWKQKFPQARA